MTDKVSRPTTSRDVQLLLVSISLNSAFTTSTVWTVAGTFVNASITRVDQPQFHARIVSSRAFPVPKELPAYFYSTLSLPLAIITNQSHLSLICVRLFTAIQYLWNWKNGDKRCNRVVKFPVCINICSICSFENYSYLTTLMQYSCFGKVEHLMNGQAPPRAGKIDRATTAWNVQLLFLPLSLLQAASIQPIIIFLFAMLWSICYTAFAIFVVLCLCMK